MNEGLRLDALAFGYGSALTEPISLDIAPSEVVAILGASGSGKSTLLATVAGIVPAVEGRVFVDGHDVTSARSNHVASASSSKSRCCSPIWTAAATSHTAYGAMAYRAERLPSAPASCCAGLVSTATSIAMSAP